MKKIVAIGFISAFYLLGAIGIDQQSAKVSFTGYKTADFVGVDGTFKDVKYEFGKNTNTISDLLKGASATINAQSVDSNLSVATRNLKRAFFGNFEKKDIKVVFEEVTSATNNTGAITAKITMNGKDNIVPLQYEIKGNKFVAQGLIDLNAFALKNAIQALTKAAPGHDGLTWSIVKIEFSANVKD